MIGVPRPRAYALDGASCAFSQKNCKVVWKCLHLKMFVKFAFFLYFNQGRPSCPMASSTWYNLGFYSRTFLRGFNKAFNFWPQVSLRSSTRVRSQSGCARIHLPPPVLIELLISAHHCIFNGLSTLGNQVWSLTLFFILFAGNSLNVQ